MISIRQGTTELYEVYDYTFSESVMGESTVSLTLMPSRPSLAV